MNKSEMIQKLIDCPCVPFTANDRKWLDGQTEENLQKFADAGEARAKELAVNEKKPAEPTGGTPGNQQQTQPSPQPVKFNSVEEAMKAMPPEIARTMQRAIDAEKAKKDGLVTGLTANKACKYTKEQLEAKDIEELETLSASLAAASPRAADFRGRVPDVTTNDNPNQIPPMPRMFAHQAGYVDPAKN